MAVSALRPFVRLSRRLERQVVTPVPPAPAADPAPARPAADATSGVRPPDATSAVDHRPAPAPAPAARASVPHPTPAEVDVEETATETALAAEQFQAVDASVVPVPIESLNRLVIAVDELGSEMTHVRQAIRDLTAALSESQANFAQLLSSAQAAGTPQDAPDPLDAVTGPYVSGEPTPTPFPAQPTPFPAQPTPTPTFEQSAPPAAAAAPEPPTVPMPVSAPIPEYAELLGSEHADEIFAQERANGLGDLPIVSTGAALVVIGPIASLEELDDAIEHMRRINGVESVAVTSFEGPQVVLTADLSRALPLASLLRTALGREVASCRLVDHRIVVDFGGAGSGA